jgi:hypothetical protein
MDIVKNSKCLTTIIPCQDWIYLIALALVGQIDLLTQSTLL